MSSGSEKIVSNILSGAQKIADENIAKAKTEEAAIIAKGEENATNTKNKISDNAAKQANINYQRIISEAKMNARRAQLGAREEVIEAAFEKAQEELKNIASTSSEQYSKSLEKMIIEAATEIGGGNLIVYLKSDDFDKIKEKHIFKGSLADLEKEIENQTGNKTKLEIGDSINTIGGAVIKTENGDIEVNNTIEARMLRFKKDLRSQVAKILFD